MAEKKTSATAFIDVHNHYLPPGYHDAVKAAFNGSPDGIPRLPDWSSSTALEMMDRQGIATAMLSVSSPGVHFGGDQAARSLARSVNEFAARLTIDHPGRFGAFASLPMPDVDGALQEIAYALDVLKLDGFVMLTNANGIYLGDERFAPVFDELNRRHAVVFI
ncbi:MAG: amidohydrolase family protein, partial [Candidatus Binataceae bacterium]